MNIGLGGGEGGGHTRDRDLGKVISRRQAFPDQEGRKKESGNAMTRGGKERKGKKKGATEKGSIVTEALKGQGGRASSTFHCVKSAQKAGSSEDFRKRGEEKGDLADPPRKSIFQERKVEGSEI